MFDEKRKNNRRRALLITAVAIIVVYILWNVPAFSFIVYPLKLFVTYAHEAGHSLAAIITGGRVAGFLVSPDGSGVATTLGGSRLLVIPAGYLGAALFGSVLFYLANRFSKYTRGIAVALGLGMLLFTLLFARPDEGGAITALLIGVIFGLGLIGMGWKLPQTFNHLVLNILAVMTALNAVLDIWQLIQHIDASRGTVSNDAAAFSSEVMPLIPATVVAAIWAGLALLMLAVAVWYGVIRPIQQEVDNAIEMAKIKRVIN